LIDGDVRFDSYSRQLYATDASAYSVTPIGVVLPTSTADVAAVVSYCAEREIPVLPRGGGTSLAGQTVNEAVVLDFTRYMDELIDIDPDAGRARAQPGITLGHLNGALEDHGLKFAPDPAWGDKSALGGAIGNNSTGSHSLQYGKTDAYVEACEVVLADGTVTTFGEVPLTALREQGDPDGDLEARIYDAVATVIDEHGDRIEQRYPELKRNVSGYNLDWIVEEAREDGTVNLARLLAGSEGTLAIVTEATVSLEPVPERTVMALLAYETLLDAVSDVQPLLAHDPAAVELVDDVLIERARETPEFASVVDLLPEGTGAVLLVEWYADSEAEGRRQVANALADRLPGVDPSIEPDPPDDRPRTDAEPYAFDALEAFDPERQATFWKLRKSGLPILLSRTTDEKHVSFIEDVAIPPEHLPEYVTGVQEILEEHDTFASFYAHAGPGVLHIRPLVNTKTEAGLDEMESIADAITDLAIQYDGSVSGEHGDGRARTQWNRKLYGEELWNTFRELKRAFDPDWLLNPGQVVYREDAPTRMTENLRAGPDDELEAGFEPELNWENDNGLEGMVELCHGCAGCRGHQDTTGGVMCPTYRAVEEESLSTRGRANMLREAMLGELPEDEQFSDEFLTEVLDLCIGCKGCAHDCPSGVDMAKLKAELTHEHHERTGADLRDALFADFAYLARLGSATAPVSNWLLELPGARTLLEKAVGIASDRTLPTVHRQTFTDRAEAFEPETTPDTARRRALLVPDLYTNYLHPEVGMAALSVLDAAGVRVDLASISDTGRPAFSKGFLERARTSARAAIDELAPAAEKGRDIVVIEPSDAVMLQSDYRDLCSGTDVETVAANTYGICEYIDRFGLDDEFVGLSPDRTLAYHGHCHQKASGRDHHAVGVLRRAGYDVTPLDSGCCGMAGSFGYEAEHYGLSQAIGSILFDQSDEASADLVVAPGASCRTQLGDRPDASPPPTPIELLAEALTD
jgi:FAD/FMN-containing dehydrogenase/Fe-S oxidoreductase